MPAGRKTILSDEMLKAIKSYADLGAYDQDIYNGMGISESAWFKWKQKGNAILQAIDEEVMDPEALTESQRKYVQFVEIMKAGRHRAILTNLAIMQVAAKTNYKAAEFFLRVHGKGRYTPTEIHETRLPGITDPVEDEEAERIQKELARFLPETAERLIQEPDEYSYQGEQGETEPDV